MSFQRTLDIDFPNERDTLIYPQQDTQPPHGPPGIFSKVPLIEPVLHQENYLAGAQIESGSPGMLASGTSTTAVEKSAELDGDSNSIRVMSGIMNIQAPVSYESADINAIPMAPVATMLKSFNGEGIYTPVATSAPEPRGNDRVYMAPVASMLTYTHIEKSHPAPVTPDSRRPEDHMLASQGSTLPVPTGNGDSIQPKPPSLPSTGTPKDTESPVKDVSDDAIRDEEGFQVEALCDTAPIRIRVGKKMKVQKQWFVKWAGYSHAENTWEPEERLRKDLGEQDWNNLYNEYVKLRESPDEVEKSIEQGNSGSNLNKQNATPDCGPKTSPRTTVSKKKKVETAFPRKRGQARLLDNKKRRTA